MLARRCTTYKSWAYLASWHVHKAGAVRPWCQATFSTGRPLLPFCTEAQPSQVGWQAHSCSLGGCGWRQLDFQPCPAGTSWHPCHAGTGIAAPLQIERRHFPGRHASCEGWGASLAGFIAAIAAPLVCTILGTTLGAGQGRWRTAVGGSGSICLPLLRQHVADCLLHNIQESIIFQSQSSATANMP
jgi:hypothetical protein